MSEYVPDAVYGDRTREEMDILARQGGARRRAIEQELREREAANVLANLAAANSQFEMEPTIGGDSQWQSFVNETPGSERQATLNPEGYAMQREMVAEGHREQAQAEMAKYGTGSDLNPTQQQARMDLRDADDRRRHQPHVEEQRIARMAQRAGVTMAEARKMVNDGYQSAGASRQMHPDSRMVVGQPNDSPPPSSDYARDAYQDLRDAGTDRRSAALNARNTEVAKRAQLLLNPMSYLAREDITPDQRQVVTARMTPPRGRSGDPRIAVAEINAAAETTRITAEREARINQQQWAEKTRIAAEAAAVARAAEAAAAANTFAAEQAKLDREARVTAQEAARTEADAARAEQKLADEHKQAQTMAALATADNKADHRQEQTMTQMRGQFDAESNARTAARTDAAAEAAKQEKELLMRSFDKYGEGARHIADGDYDTPAAGESLRSMAADSDQSWTGFYNSDARRMDAILLRLGVQDPDVRRNLVDQYGRGGVGMAPGTGGRSGPVSRIVNFLSGGY
jgi:hypothetical protein